MLRPAGRSRGVDSKIPAGRPQLRPAGVLEPAGRAKLRAFWNFSLPCKFIGQPLQILANFWPFAFSRNSRLKRPIFTPLSQLAKIGGSGLKIGLFNREFREKAINPQFAKICRGPAGRPEPTPDTRPAGRKPTPNRPEFSTPISEDFPGLPRRPEKNGLGVRAGRRWFRIMRGVWSR